MTLHPGARGRYFPEEAPVAWDPIRRDLEKNQDWYRDLVEHSQDLLSVHDLDGRLLSVNPVPARLLGYTVPEMLQKPLRDFVDPRFLAEYDAYLRQIRCTGESHGLVAVMTRSGEQRIWEYHNTLRTEGVDTPIVRGIAHDVTDRVRAEQALRKTNKALLQTAQERERILQELTLFRRLLDQSNDSLEIIDSQTLRFLDVNETACVQLGYSREELLAMTVFNIDPNARERFLGVRQQLEQSGSVMLETVHRRKDGTTFPVEVNLRRVHLDRDYNVVVARDITRRKRAQERLQEFERVVESLEEMIVVLDREYRYVIVNQSYLNYRKLTKDQVIGRLASEVMGPGMFESIVKEKLDECFHGKIVNYEHTNEYPGISTRDLSVTYVPIEGSHGIDRIACVLRDVTEDKRAENALRESAALFRAVYERSPVGITLVDSQTGRFLQANSKFCEITGRGEEELLQIDVAGITHPDDIASGNEYLRQLAEGTLASYEMEKRYLRPDGSVRWVRILVVPMWDKGETRRWHMALAQDITERRRTEGAIATLVQKVRADSSESFFTSMAVQLATCLEADYTIIGEIIEGEEDRVRTIGVCGQGVIADNFTRELADTPCGEVVAKGACSYISGVNQLFPKDSLLKQLKVEGYTGTPLRDSQGRTIGLMVALYTQPLTNASFAEMILQLFSTHTAAEIERKRTEEALRQSEERFRVAIKNSPIAVFNQDRDLRYTWVYNSQLPLSDVEKLGKTMTEFMGPAEAARISAIRRRVLETGAGLRHEAQLTFGGRKRYLDTTIEPLLDASGAVIGLTGASMDITELRETSEALREAKKKLTEEKLYLEQEIDTELGFGEIIGQSKALQAVMQHVGKVAASDATVLLLGETGTGKELVARAIHRLSLRANNSFIKMNCAAIPSGLLESELFGNEKGAFTGAVSKKIGRIELADKGTLFLDEIGEISLSLQPKLLRVLQDQEFERLGGTHTLKVDFRLIAATNRDLADCVRENEFRSDLYYRLNVFPIRVPPLRERREDIRLLVEHFVQKCARRMNKSITSIPKKTLDALMEWEWPGNVRELENFVERSVILTQGSVLVSPLSELKPAAAEPKSADETLEGAEREHILRALRESHGQIGGPKGAAARLGLKRTTLQSKLKHLGINPRMPPKQ
jgi:PAS domain S-box-containing protein